MGPVPETEKTMTDALNSPISPSSSSTPDVNSRAEGARAAGSATERLISKIGELIAPLGYEVVHLEVHSSGQRTIRLFIDRLDAASTEGIGIQDCVTVSRALSEPLDAMEEVTAIFKDATYELEVSSPGVDRPLRQEKDFEKFTGREVRIHVYRPLSGEELENVTYAEKNPRQKNFLGRLAGLRNGKVLLSLQTGSIEKKKKKSKEKTIQAVAAPEVAIPLPMIAKANLEPHFDGLSDN